MKKLIIISLIIMSSASFLCARPTGLSSLVIADDPQGVSPTSTVGIGDAYIEDTLEVGGEIIATSGIVNVHETWPAVPAKSATLIQTTAISTATLVSAATTWTLAASDLTDIVHPRNLTAIAVFTNGNSTSTFTGSLAIVGVGARGQAVTETLTISTNSATGNEAYSSVTSATLTSTTISGGTENSEATINIGNGDKLGLSNNITAITDVYKIVEGDALLLPSASSINVTFDTYITSDIPDGSDNFEIWYKAISR